MTTINTCGPTGRTRTSAPSYVGSLGLSLPIALAVFLCGPWVAPVEAKDPNISDRIGVDVHLDTNERMALIADSGMGWMRADFDWYGFEPAKGQFDWTMLDAVVDRARTNGLNIFPSIGYTPSWATDGPERTGVPRNASDWTDAVTAAVTRYQDDIEYWGIWNEPNTTSFWTASRQEFIDVIVKPGADAIHAANPNAKVLGPELAHFFSSERLWYRWLQDILAQAGDKIDIISHHTYPRPLASSYTSITSLLNKTTYVGDNPDMWGFFGIHPSVREVFAGLNWSGDVCLTEFGWRTSDMSEQAIADNYTGLFNDWLTQDPNRDWIDKLMLYHSGDDEYGIFNPDGSLRQAYYAIKDFIEAQTPGPGDADGDGLVDSADLAIWQQHYDPLGLNDNTFSMGDWNDDGLIDSTDLAIWQQHYAPLGGTGAVPEPTTLSLLSLSTLLLAARRRAKRSC